MGEMGQPSGAGGSAGASSVRTTTVGSNENVHIGANRSETVSQNESTTIGGGGGAAAAGGGEKGQGVGTGGNDLRQIYESQIRELYQSLARTVDEYERQLLTAYQNAVDQVRRDPLGVAPTPQLPPPQSLPVPPAFASDAAAGGEKGQNADTPADPSSGGATDTGPATPADPSGG